MNQYLYSLCLEYVRCYGSIQTLIAVEGIDAERLKLFSLLINRCNSLEAEISQCTVESELKSEMELRE